MILIKEKIDTWNKSYSYNKNISKIFQSATHTFELLSETEVTRMSLKITMKYFSAVFKEITFKFEAEELPNKLLWSLEIKNLRIKGMYLYTKKETPLPFLWTQLYKKIEAQM